MSADVDDQDGALRGVTVKFHLGGGQTAGSGRGEEHNEATRQAQAGSGRGEEQNATRQAQALSLPPDTSCQFGIGTGAWEGFCGRSGIKATP